MLTNKVEICGVQTSTLKVLSDDRMKELASAMAFSACGGSGDVSLFVYDGEHFLIIIALHVLRY